MKDWLTKAVIAKLEDEIDTAEGLASLAETEGTLSLEAYLKSSGALKKSSSVNPPLRKGERQRLP
jgi:hypothetical protein